MIEKRFTYGLRKGTTQYEIQDSLHEFPIVEPFYYESFAKKVCNFLNDLNDENEQLKQRNNRQYEQLDRLYNLIEQKDWRALNDILDDFKRCEKQLQREWGAYGDVE